MKRLSRRTLASTLTPHVGAILTLAACAPDTTPGTAPAPAQGSSPPPPGAGASPAAAVLTAPEGFAAVNGAQLYYETRGRGRPVVFVHSALLDRRMWRPQADALAERFRVITYDARGYGRSDLPAAPYSNALDLRTLLRLLDATPAHAVGCSFGGTVALDLAIEHPDSVSSLTLVNSPLNGLAAAPDPYASEWSAALAAIRAGGPSQDLADAFVRLFVDGQGSAAQPVRAEVRALLADYRFAHYARGAPVAASVNHSARLTSLRMPALVVLGERDIPTIHEHAAALAARLPGARKVVIPDAAHLPNLEQPDAFNRELLSFLTALP